MVETLLAERVSLDTEAEGGALCQEVGFAETRRDSPRLAETRRRAAGGGEGGEGGGRAVVDLPRRTPSDRCARGREKERNARL